MRSPLEHLWSRAGLLPPFLKRPFLARVLAAIQRRIFRKGLAGAWSNLGISSKFRLRFSSLVPEVYLFGRPDQYDGERGPLYLARELAPRCDAFIDVGAYQGYFTFFVRAALPPEIPICFVEPEPSLYAQIEENVRRNALPNVKGWRIGIGARNGSAPFYCHPDSLISSMVKDFGQGTQYREIQIEVVTFGELASREGFARACVKVDTENAEMDFLRGIQDAGPRINYLICEVLEPAQKENFIAKAEALLGMHSYYINDFSLEHSPGGAFRYCPPQYNWLFCRETPAELARLLHRTRFSVKSATNEKIAA